MHRVKAKFAPFRVGATNFAFEIQLNIIMKSIAFIHHLKTPQKKTKHSIV